MLTLPEIGGYPSKDYFETRRFSPCTTKGCRLRGRWKKKTERCRGAATSRKTAMRHYQFFSPDTHPSFLARTWERSAFRITRLRKYFLNNFALTSMRRRSGSWIEAKKEKKKRGGWTFMEYFASSLSTSYVNLIMREMIVWTYHVEINNLFINKMKFIFRFITDEMDDFDKFVNY